METSYTYRDTLTTVDQSGHRKWVYAERPHGNLYNKRAMVSLVLLCIFFVTPFVKIGNKPLFLFKIFERKFIVFGNTFWPQDFHIFLILMLIFFVFIVLFTAVFGRIFCGWICPQTVFLEFIFRNIEYLIEGDARKQQKRDLEEGGYTWRKFLKYTIYSIISFFIGNLAMSYLVGVDQLALLISHPITDHPAMFVGVLAFSSIFMFVFTWLREQACTIVCPYGRLQ